MGQAISRPDKCEDNNKFAGLMSHDREHQRSQKLKKRHRRTDGDSSEDEPAAKRIRMVSCQRTTPIQYSLHRDGHIYTSKHMKVKDRLEVEATVRPSPRNKKQHLRQLSITSSHAQSDAEASILLSQDGRYMKRSFGPFTPPVKSSEEKLCEEDQKTTCFLEDTVGGSTDEKHTATECELLRMENKQLQAELKRKDAQIRKLKQQSDRTTRKLVKGRIGDLEWCLLYKPDGQPQVLGNGTYGRVYKAFCDSKGKYLAAKVVLDLTPEYAEILQKELKQLIALEPHDRIVTYFGACYAKHPRFDEECLFVFTEFMPGGSLSSYLDKKGPLTKTLMWHYTVQILEGVEYLHECGIIHRDIKGSNIMRDRKKNVKLADFGSAKQICSESLNKDKTRYPYGTAPWAAPEVLRGEKAQPESDIWSVAATIVEMLTGEMPYKTENFEKRQAIVYQVGSNKINPLTSMKKSGYGLDWDVECILTLCFERIAKERPSAADLSKLISLLKTVDL